MIFTRLIRRSNDSLLDSTTTHSLHSFRYASTTLWNRLPEDLRSTTFLIGSLNSKCDKFRLNKYSNTRNGYLNSFLIVLCFLSFILFLLIFLG